MVPTPSEEVKASMLSWIVVLFALLCIARLPGRLSASAKVAKRNNCWKKLQEPHQSHPQRNKQPTNSQSTWREAIHKILGLGPCWGFLECCLALRKMRTSKSSWFLQVSWYWGCVIIKMPQYVIKTRTHTHTHVLGIESATLFLRAQLKRRWNDVFRLVTVVQTNLQL